MPIYKELKVLKDCLKHYEDKIPINNMGKWSKSVAIVTYKRKIAKLESKLSKNDSI